MYYILIDIAFDKMWDAVLGYIMINLELVMILDNGINGHC